MARSVRVVLRSVRVVLRALQKHAYRERSCCGGRVVVFCICFLVLVLFGFFSVLLWGFFLLLFFKWLVCMECSTSVQNVST